MIDYKRKCVILHPPKTGGQALMAALGMPNGRGAGEYFAYWRHDTLTDVWGKLPELRDWPVYLLVRNPFARMVSYYHYVVQTPYVKLNPVLRYVRSFASCEQFLDNAEFHALREAAMKHKNGALESCAYYATVAIAAKDGSESYTYHDGTRIIMAEHMAMYAKRYFGIANVPVVNASDHRDWKIYYNERRRERVREYLADDFYHFGYGGDD